MQQSHSNITPKIVGFLVILAVTATGAYFFLFKTIDSDSMASTGSTTASSTTASTATSSEASATSTEAEDTTTTSASTVSASGYTAGTYSATISYSVPHGSNSIAVDVTVDASGTITDVSDDHSYSDHESGWYIESFDSELSGAVVGQNISSLSLSRLGGASLTTQAFDQALSNILSQSQA